MTQTFFSLQKAANEGTSWELPPGPFIFIYVANVLSNYAKFKDGSENEREVGFDIGVIRGVGKMNTDDGQNKRRTLTANDSQNKRNELEVQHVNEREE